MTSLRPSISPQERSKALLEMQLRLDRGESHDDVRAFLVSRGLQPYEARRALDAVLSAARDADRKKGLVWLGFSVVLLLAAVPFVIAASEGLEAGVRSGVLARVGTLPVLLGLGGVVTGVRGLMLVLGLGRYQSDPD